MKRKITICCIDIMLTEITSQFITFPVLDLNMIKIERGATAFFNRQWQIKPGYILKTFIIGIMNCFSFFHEHREFFELFYSHSSSYIIHNRPMPVSGNIKFPPLLGDTILISAFSLQSKIKPLISFFAHLRVFEMKNGSISTNENFHGIERPHGHIAVCSKCMSLILRTNTSCAIFDNF